MKELQVLCSLYLKVEDETDLESALDSLYMKLDSDVAINIYESHLDNDMETYK